MILAVWHPLTVINWLPTELICSKTSCISLVCDIIVCSRLTQCSRWAELADSLRIHSKIAKYCHAPTEFRFLNQLQPFMIGTADIDEPQRYAVLQSVLDGQPSGGTPLCLHINHV